MRAAAVVLIALVLAAVSLTARAGTYAPSPGPPAGWHQTYAHDFVKQGLGDWAPRNATENNAAIVLGQKPGQQFGVGIRLTATGQFGRLDNLKALVGPNTMIKELVFVPPVPGTHQAANWPAWWTAANPWPESGEIDMLEGIRGNSGMHTWYGPSPAGKVGSPNRSAPGNVPGTGWLTITILRQNGVVKGWYDNTYLGQVPLPTNGTEHLIFQDQSYSTTVCASCFGPFAASTAWLSRVTVWSK